MADYNPPPTTVHSYIRVDAVKAIGNGYSVCGIVPKSKRPAGKDWQKASLTPEACLRRPEGQGYGILCGIGEFPVCAIDADIEDPDLARAFWTGAAKVIPGLDEAPARIGKHPKRLVMLRAAYPFWRKAASASFKVNGRKCRIEFLGKGQQFVAGGIHPDTGKPYVWEGSTPATFPAANLPVIQPRDVDRLISIFEESARIVNGEELCNVAADARQPFTTEEQEFLELCMPYRRVGLSIERIREVMTPRLPKWDDYSTWTADLMRISHETDGSSDGLALAMELSRQAPGFESDGDVEYHWKSYRRRSGLVLTMWPLLREINADEALDVDLSQTGLYRRCRKLLNNRVAYLTDLRTWYVFDPERHCWDSQKGAGYISQAVDTAINHLSGEAAAEENEERKEAILKFQTECRRNLMKMRTAVFHSFSNQLEFMAAKGDFDKDLRYFGVQNGVIDLQTGELLENRPDLKITKLAGFSYDPEARCPRIERALHEWLNNDEEVYDFVISMLAKALNGEAANGNFLVLKGTGANGKSTFFNLVSALFGGYATPLSEATITGKAVSTAGGPRTDIVGLVGARVAICSETPQDAFLRDAVVKQLSGADSISARGLYQAEFTFKPHALLMLGTNYLPVVRGTDTGIWRRIKVICFDQDYNKHKERCDPDLERKLVAELPGFFNLLLIRLPLVRGKVLNVPKAVSAEVEGYRDKMDAVKQWITSCLVADPDGAPTTMQELYRDFRSFVHNEGYTWTLAQVSFTDRVKSHFGRAEDGRFYVRKSHGTNKLFGFRLKTVAEIEETESGVSLFGED